ncbi:MAG: sel1 repeat family protein [Prevotella sp.]|nr:sel1 repeat family protein [Prevotella sp.]
MTGRLFTLAVLLACLLPLHAQQDKDYKDTLTDRQLLAVARQYRHGIIREADPVKAAGIYRHLARKGNAKATCELGRCYLNGDGVKTDTRLASALFRKAAGMGSAEAKCHLALMYQKGLDGVADHKKAYALYKEAADSGSVQGMYGAGYMLYKGMGVTQDYSEAVRLLEAGAKRKHPGCCMLLASYYANGYGGLQDLEKAERYWKQASRDGNSWTVDITKRGVADSISRRMERKGTWTHVREKVLDSETMPEIVSTVDAHDIAGMWRGKAYSYDWSRKIIVSEHDIAMGIECINDSVHIKCYTGDSLVTAYSPVLHNGKYRSRQLTAEQKEFSWTVTSTAFAMKGDHLLAELKVLNLRNRSFRKPLLAVLTRDSQAMTDNATPSFTLNSVTYTSGHLTLDITATKEMDVDIAISSVYGTPIKTYSKQKVIAGNNKIAISALLDQRDLASIVTVSHKDERHSKTITVGSHE